MKKTCRFLVVFLAACFCTASALAATATEQLASLLSNFNSMSAHFDQALYDGKGHIVQKSLGNMALQRPGKFRWEVQKPDKQLLIADGQYLWVYDVDLQQATRQKQDQGNTNSPASLLSGTVQDLQNRFGVTQLTKPGAGEWYQLKPIAKNDLFQSIELHFVDGKLANMRLFDNLGSLTTFDFTQVKVNPNLDRKLFVFKAPKGVEVIKN